MNIKEALKVLKEFDLWRRGVEPYDKDDFPFPVTDITKALHLVMTKIRLADNVCSKAKVLNTVYMSRLSRKAIESYIRDIRIAVEEYEKE